MLDRIELARRIREAMDKAEPRVKSAYLAEQCGVTPQAVHGWRTTGRVAKGYLERIAWITKKPLQYFLGNDSIPEANYEGIMEGEALARLRRALPEWRRYVIGLAMEDSHTAQKLLLDSMRKAVYDPRVEQFIPVAPHAAERAKRAQRAPAAKKKARKVDVPR
jgi:hypothetical protein